jgi:hypothetical protein
VAGTGAGLMSASPDRPTRPVAVIADGPGDLDREQITRGAQVAQVVIDISGTAWSSDPLGLPEDTRGALQTDGRTELLKALDQDDPPRIIRCGSSGCSYLPSDGVE